MSLLNQFISKEKKLLESKFLAAFNPLITQITVKIDKINYNFKIDKIKDSGVGYFKPINYSKAELVEKAEDYIVESYFNTLPKIPFILCYETDIGWVGYPADLLSSKKYNIEKSVLIFNVNDCQRFDTVICRYDSVNFWYHEIFNGNNVQKAISLRNCFQPNLSDKLIKEEFNKLNGLTKEERESFNIVLDSWVKFKKTTTEEQLKSFLKGSGGTLSSYIIKANTIELKWNSKSGNTYYSSVDKDYNVVSAGICISGDDQKFHIKDLPYLVAYAERENAVVRTRNNDHFRNNQDPVRYL